MAGIEDEDAPNADPELSTIVRVNLSGEEGGKLYAFKLADGKFAPVGAFVRARGHRVQVEALGRDGYTGPLAEATLEDEGD